MVLERNEKRLLPALLIGLLIVLVLIGCGGYDDESATDGDTDGDEVSDGDLSADDYPAGPYGYTNGEIMADFALPDCDGKTIRLSDLFGEAKAILINHSAGWCSICRVETDAKMEQWYQDLKDLDVMILQPLFETNSFAPANEAFCKAWRDQYGLTYPVLIDADNYFLDYYPSIQNGGVTTPTPLNIILDRDMRIQYLLEGDIPESLYGRLEDLASDD